MLSPTHILPRGLRDKPTRLGLGHPASGKRAVAIILFVRPFMFYHDIGIPYAKRPRISSSAKIKFLAIDRTLTLNGTIATEPADFNIMGRIGFGFIVLHVQISALEACADIHPETF